MTPLRDWPLRSHAEQASDLFTAERHRELAAFQDLYIGLAPGDAPAVFSLLQAIELAPPSDEASDCGIFYPLGPNPNPNPNPDPDPDPDLNQLWHLLPARSTNPNPDSP